MNRTHDVLALLAVVGCALGIGVASLFPLSVPLCAFLLLLSAGFFIAWFFGKRNAYFFLALLLLTFSLGAVRLLFVPQSLPRDMATIVGTPTTLQGVVVADPDVRETNERITFTFGEGREHINIIATTDRHTPISVGDRIEVTGTPHLPEPFATDGGRIFAYDTFLRKDGVFLLMPAAQVQKSGESSSLILRAQKFLFRAKHAFARGLEAALPEPHASLAEGLLIGGKQGLGKILLEAFTTAGLLPIIVLSGYNVLIVAEAVLMSRRILPKNVALLLAGIVILLFVVASGSGSSAIRAGLMAGVALFARATGRVYDALRALLFVFVVMLLQNPLLLLFDPGFQFSCVATLGLIVLSPRFEVALIRVPHRAVREVCATTLAAQLFVLPLLLYQTGALSWVAVPANIVVLPFIPLAMLCSVIAGTIGMIVPIVAPFFGLPAYVLLSFVIMVADSAARLPLARVTLPAFPWYVLIPLYGLLGWYTRALIQKPPTNSTRSSAVSSL